MSFHIRRTLLAALAAILIAPVAHGTNPNTTQAVLYTFTGGADGAAPRGTLISDSAGALYGTTLRGGDTAQCAGAGCGTVFRVSPPATAGSAWTFTVLYTFEGAADGAYPLAGLTMDGNGNLYGTAKKGGGSGCGGYGCGTVFELSPPSSATAGWSFSALHQFSGTDGAFPEAELTFDGPGNLLGTTTKGGPAGQGTVFRLDPPLSAGAGWVFAPVTSFSGGGDGGNPASPPLADSAGNLYGTTLYGGSTGAGVIYRLTPPANGQSNWTGAVLYNFPGNAGGGYARGALFADEAGTLYGTATDIAFSLTPNAGTWTATILHAFSSLADANIPSSGLAEVIYPNATALYGTGGYGGNGRAGVIYKLTAPAPGGSLWTESLLYAFTGATDGANPQSGILPGRGGVLYGTTTFGGDLTKCDVGCGIIYMITP